MSAPIKLAAIRHAVSALHHAADEGTCDRRYADALQQAGETLDELIAAAREAEADYRQLVGMNTERLSAALAPFEPEPGTASAQQGFWQDFDDSGVVADSLAGIQQPLTPGQLAEGDTTAERA